jgi:hypothetical protein
MKFATCYDLTYGFVVSLFRYTQVMYLVLQFLVLLFLLLTAQQNLMHEFYYPQSLLMVIIQTYLVIHHWAPRL